NKVNLFAKSLKSASNIQATQEELSLYLNILQMNKNIPILIFNEKGKLLDSKNVKFKLHEKKLPKATLLKIKKMQKEPIEITIGKTNFQYVYYGHSPTLQKLQYMPILQLFLILLLATLAYILFRNTQTSRQNKVWAGLSKETAHQLGTPISSLIAWLELMEAQNIAPDYLPEMQKDVERLKVVSNRFSHIGSTPKRELQNIIPLIEETVNYMNLRTSKSIIIHLASTEKTLLASVNKELFTWVIENLIKNAVDAIVNKGKITIFTKENENTTYIDIEDTGKGIKPNAINKIFETGYSTKKRGWGLGLSLTKRIVEDFHNGRIFVKNSGTDGTVFRIVLSKSNKE
ncbi:MAG: HAMP domain-containing histidine kinase, partial [Flavobacteriaceae bacterium]|nr:HAMP domain-containing histidine kinase [Flavobacteriaceae bacterium]